MSDATTAALPHEHSLDSLIELVAKHLVFDAEHYPELKGAAQEERFAFAIRHSALHFAKTAGKIAAISEDADHGGDIDVEELRKNVPKALVNTLRLAELVGMKEDDLVRAITTKHKTTS